MKEIKRERLGLPFENSAAFASDDCGRLGLPAVRSQDDNFLVSKHEEEEGLADHIRYKDKNYTLKEEIIIRC